MHLCVALIAAIKLKRRKNQNKKKQKKNCSYVRIALALHVSKCLEADAEEWSSGEYPAPKSIRDSHIIYKCLRAYKWMNSAFLMIAAISQLGYGIAPAVGSPPSYLPPEQS